jgi:tetratricopeptide (TPR) repeat protein
MFSSRNIHFAVLGIILGATTGYIFAFYQAHRSVPRTAPGAQSSNLPQGHPDVSNDELLTMFKQALEKNPNNPELMTKYANFLFDLGRFNESVEWFGKVAAIQPDNLDVRTDLATALWNAGQREKAMAEYEGILRSDPKHIATLHNLAIVHFGERDFAAAERVIQRIEAADPNYEGLQSLKNRLAELKK